MSDLDITNTNDVKTLMLDVIYFIENYGNIKNEIKNKIYIENGKQDDYLHEIELAKLNGIELMQVSKKLKEVRINRRIYKDKLELLEKLNPYVSKFITKGILAESKILIENIDRLVDNQNTRQYTPRVIKDLKCVKKEENTDEKS
ncbi:MAG: hypothetical protein IKM97_04865 [Clostridia bacterium]|nr:hypothetical protein [Clostridia bacterium]